MARGLVGSRSQHAELLEVRQMRVNGGGRGQPDRLADVAHRRRIAVVADVALDEVEDLLLSLGEVQLDHADSPPDAPIA